MPCVTEEHRTPLLMADASGIDDSLLQQAYPYLFSLQMSESRVLRNWPYWGNTRRLLQGKRLGLYYDSSIDADIKQNLLSTLNRLGYKPVVVASTDQSTGGPEDGVVVQQFRAAGVNAALMMVGAVTQTDFMQQADAQGYRPAWIENEYLDNIGDTAPSTYPPAEFDGSFGMAGLAAGQTSAPVSPQANACVDNYVRYTRETRPSVGNAKWNSILISCDLGSALITTLERAGRALTTTSYIHAMESIEHMVVSYTPPVTFTSAKHAGVDDVRTVRWTAAGCKCWTIVEDYRPLWTP
jgi:ABC-type branched-subunit amino acid transport system substrate-binding protein